MPYTETNYENAIIELFEKKLGYSHYNGYEIARDYHIPYHKDFLLSSIQKINSNLPQEAINEAISKITNFDTPNLLQANEIFMDYLQNGVELTYISKGQEKHTIVNLIDYDNIDKNNFFVINQWTFIDKKEKRPDIVVFVNGLPLVVIELKSCSREDTDTSEAYNQIRNYLQDIPTLFFYNAFCVISDLSHSRAGTITSDESRFMEWKSVSGGYEEIKIADFKTLFMGMFEKERFLDILKNFILFRHDRNKNTSSKILAAYHQYYAVRKAIERTETATESDGRIGVFWHTQGSGKSLSMVFYAKLLRSVLNSVTFVVLTDRNDLDGQLFRDFSNCQSFLRQEPLQATSRENLKELLKNRVANGIIFTTMQKFEEYSDPLSDRRDIVLIADEAHRSQYGLTETIKNDGKISVGYARLVRDSLPNAAFIGFTGTPIDSNDRSTPAIFGDYIDIYDMTQSVEDGATKPIYYESRVMNLDLDEDILKQIDEAYGNMNADEINIEKSKKELGKMESILGAEDTIDSLCQDIISHYEDRQDLLSGKAMIVAYSRSIAIKIYKKIISLRPDWADGKIHVVMTSANKDPEEWGEIIKKKSKSELEAEFKDNNSKMKIALVVDMWLTGFDVPSLATMYIYKPMKGHNLMQAITRVNRVFEDKEGGLIVDYIGIASELKLAMKDFTRRDKENYEDNDIAKTAYPKFQEKLEVLRDLFFGFSYKKFFEGSDYDRAEAISEGANFIIADDQRKDIYIKEAMLLRQAHTLSISLLSNDERKEFAYFEAVRVILTKIVSSGKLSLKDINEKINELLKHAIKSEGVINLFGDGEAEFSIFNQKHLDEISKMKQQNIAVEMLKKLLEDQVKIYKRTNIVKSKLFSDRMKSLMNAYKNSMISNADVIEELRKMAEEMNSDDSEAKGMGLSSEEKAFYDAITRPENIKDFYENETLVALTKELTDTLRKNRTIDWQKKDTARAKMRSMVKRLLKKYKYPPEGREDALKWVIEQCEAQADNM